jgi:sulfate permease, SulP family
MNHELESPSVLRRGVCQLGTPQQTAAIAELPTTLYCLSKSNLQTLRQEHPQVATVFEDFIIRLLVERLMYARTEVEELL